MKQAIAIIFMLMISTLSFAQVSTFGVSCTKATLNKSTGKEKSSYKEDIKSSFDITTKEVKTVISNLVTVYQITKEPIYKEITDVKSVVLQCKKSDGTGVTVVLREFKDSMGDEIIIIPDFIDGDHDYYVTTYYVFPFSLSNLNNGEKINSTTIIPESAKNPVAVATQVNTPVSQTQIVNIPDAKFKAKLIGKHLDLNKDGQIQYSEARSVKVLDISEASISDLTGIEAFTNLTNLKCSMNLFTTLNLSCNTALTELDCSGLYLNALDLTRNTAIKTLICSKDHLFNLDLSKNTSLTNLQCHQNNLTALDLCTNRILKEIYCGYNQLKNLDVSKNTALQTIYCMGNPGLENVCVNTKQLGLIKTNTLQWQKGDHASWSTECSTEK
jgi:hypothetical protein